MPFSRELYVERDDFRDDAPQGLVPPGARARGAAALRLPRHAAPRSCKDAAGEVMELRCTWDPHSWGGNAPDGRTVRGTLHWVSAAHAVDAEVRLYDRLFSVENPGTTEGTSFLDEINPRLARARDRRSSSRSWRRAAAGRRACSSSGSATSASTTTAARQAVWNRTVTLKDSWAKIEKKSSQAKRPARTSDSKSARRRAKPEKPRQRCPKPTRRRAAPAAPPAEIAIDDFGKRRSARRARARGRRSSQGADKLMR